MCKFTFDLRLLKLVSGFPHLGLGSRFNLGERTRICDFAGKLQLPGTFLTSLLLNEKADGSRFWNLLSAPGTHARRAGCNSKRRQAKFEMSRLRDAKGTSEHKVWHCAELKRRQESSRQEKGDRKKSDVCPLSRGGSKESGVRPHSSPLLPRYMFYVSVPDDQEIDDDQYILGVQTPLEASQGGQRRLWM